MSNSRIVVTGIGASSPLGGTAPESWSALLDGVSGARTLEYDWVEKYQLPVTFAAEAKVRPDTVLERPVAKRLDPSSQFALIAVVASGGSAAVAIATSTLVGTRNAFYGFAMSPVLQPRGAQRFLAAQATIDESTGMAARYQGDRDSARLAFWATAGSIYVLWNLGTLIGAVGAGLIDDPNAFGLDAAAPAAFLALVWPRLTTWPMRIVAIVSLGSAVALAPFVAAGVPVLLAGAAGIVIGLILGVRAGEQ